MSASYDPNLSTDRDYVRFLLGDVTIASAKFSDEEIDAMLSEQTATGSGRKYCAAARLLGILQTQLGQMGDGLLSKTVSELSREWGIDGNAAQVIEQRIVELRMECSRRISARPWQFRIAGGSNTRFVR